MEVTNIANTDLTETREHTFYSQLGEDKLILETFFSNKKNGFFVELGAMDGNAISNTKMFQEQMGWSGVLIEPSSEYEKLRVNPRCHGGAVCLNVAICESWRMAEFMTGGNPAVGGLVETMTDKHKHKFFTRRGRKIQVPCGPIGQILRMVGVQHIDFFSIDVEGGEIYVIRGMDWSIPVKVIMLERSEENNHTKEIDEILTRNGFTFYMKTTTSWPSVIWVSQKSL